MSLFTERDEYQVGSLQNGLPTCVFAPKTYHRIITTIVVGNSVTSGVKCYRGLLGSTPVAQNLLGSNNTLQGPIRVPAGQSFFVQWSAAAANVKDAFARVSWERDDSPLEASVSGGSGWSTEAVTSLQIPTAALPGEPRLVIGADLPPPLDTYQVTAYGIGAANFVAAIIWYARDTSGTVDDTYSFIGVLDNGIGIGTYLVYGMVHSGSVREYSAGRPAGLTTLTFGAGVTSQLNALYDDISISVRPGATGGIIIQTPNVITMFAGHELHLDTPEWSLNGVTLARGFKAETSDTAASAAIGAEAVVQTTGSFVWETGRAYAIRWCCTLVSSVAQNTILRARKTNLAGQLLEGWQEAVPAGALQRAREHTWYVTNVSGADIAAALALTMQATAGTVTQGAGGALGVPRRVVVEDVGSAAQYPNVFASIV